MRVSNISPHLDFIKFLVLHVFAVSEIGPCCDFLANWANGIATLANTLDAT